jgi:hypothetical protein
MSTTKLDVSEAYRRSGADPILSALAAAERMPLILNRGGTGRGAPHDADPDPSGDADPVSPAHISDGSGADLLAHEETGSHAIVSDGSGQDGRDQEGPETDRVGRDRENPCSAPSPPSAGASTDLPQEDRPVRLPLTCAAAIAIEPIDWLWKGRLAARTIAVLDGDPGLGKSTLTAYLAACVSRGLPFPGEKTGRPPAGVLLISLEDSPSAIIAPRLDAAGADRGRIQLWDYDEDQFTLPHSIETLRIAIRHCGVRLVIVDPIMATLAVSLDAHRDQHVRGVLSRIAAIAESERTAFLFVRHLNKNLATSPLYRGGGSIGIIGAARTALLLAKDPNDPDSRILAMLKSNLGPLAPSLRFHLEGAPPPAEGIEVAAIAWDGEARETAEDLLSPPSDSTDQSALGEAEAFLEDILQAGPMPSKEVFNAAKQAGVAKRTLMRAKKELGVDARRPGGPKGPWSWYLPGSAGGEDLGDLGTDEPEEGEEP